MIANWLTVGNWPLIFLYWITSCLTIRFNIFGIRISGPGGIAGITTRMLLIQFNGGMTSDTNFYVIRCVW